MRMERSARWQSRGAPEAAGPARRGLPWRYLEAQGPSRHCGRPCRAAGRILEHCRGSAVIGQRCQVLPEHLIAHFDGAGRQRQEAAKACRSVLAPAPFGP
jgi:hypothetical protein